MESTEAEGLLIFHAAKSNIIAGAVPSGGECASDAQYTNRSSLKRAQHRHTSVRMTVSIQSGLVLIAFVALMGVTDGNVLLVAYEETEQAMLSIFEDNLGRSLMLTCLNRSKEVTRC